jgi:hypothetical protein
LEAVIGETIQFYPHSDAGVSFDALVLNVQPKMEKNLAFLYYVDITVLSVNYIKFGTNLTLTSPNGSEVLQRNQVFNITWTSYGITGNVALELWKNGSKLSDIDTSEANDGSYAWTVPADATAGTDYQIKILNSTGYIYDLSDANFSIDYDGYFLFDGTNDYLNNTHALTWGNAYTIAFSLKHPTGTILKGYPDFAFIYHIPDYNYSCMGCYTHGNGSMRAADQSGNYADLDLPNGTFAVDNTWHKYVAIVNKALGYIAFYKDGNLVAEESKTVYIHTTPKVFIFGRSGNGGYINTAQVKNILITSHQFSAIDITNYGSGNITAIDNKVLWYKCNDADAGTPWTDNAVDSSGNGNHGTPTNVQATFFNQS